MTSSLAAFVRRFRSVLTFAPFDPTTEDGRANERFRRVLLTSGASVVAKVVSLATMLISVPLTLHYLGTERFGLWVTLSSLIMVLGFADFGIGNGLLNAVSDANGRDDPAEIRRSVSSALVCLSAIGALLLVALVPLYAFVPWDRVFNVATPLAREEAGTGVVVLVTCIALNLPIGVVQRTQMGLQIGFVANLWQAIGSVLGLVAVLLAIHLELGLPWLVGAIFGVPALAGLGNGIVFFGWKRPELAPARSAVSREVVSRIARTGLLFFVLQIAVSVAYASDNIVISRVLGAAAVPDYAIPDRMFSMIPLFLGMALTPLWPAYGEAVARGDGAWVKSVFVRSLKIAVALSATAACGFILFARPILSAWIGRDVDPAFMLLLGIGIWKVFEAWGIATAAFLNGTNTVRLQAILGIAMAGVAITLKIILAQRLGVMGVVWATIIAYSTVTFIPITLAIPKILEKFRS